MITIKDRQEANKYYKMVNEIVDNFIKETKARPIEAYNYIKKNLNKFLANKNLNQIQSIDRIVMDVIEHRRGVELDKVEKFESFQNLYENIADLRTNQTKKEKIIADFFHISSDHVETINKDLNVFGIDDFGDKFSICILSDSDLEVIKQNFKDYLRQSFMKKDFNFSDVTNKFFNDEQIWKLSDLMDEEKVSLYLDNLIHFDSLINYYKHYLQKCKISVMELKYLGDSNGFKFWKIAQ